MNLKRGFLRLTLVVSLVAPLIPILCLTVSYGDIPPADDWIEFSPICGILFAAVWATYAIIRWLVKGFQENID